jgi:hypothetical protein
MVMKILDTSEYFKIIILKCSKNITNFLIIMFIKILSLFYLVNKSPILLFPGLGASKLIKNNLDV